MTPTEPTTQTEPYPVLPRELTDLSDEVRAVPAPPLPVLDDPYAIRAVDPEGPDTELVWKWMSQPHLLEAWEYDWPAERWYKHLRAQVDGEYSRPLLLSHNGNPFAYLELYRAAKDSIAPRYDAKPHDLGLHAAIADLTMVQKGIGANLLPRIARSVFDGDPQCRRMMFDPDHRNTGARRLCELSGTVYLGEHDMPNRRMALYALPRTPEDASAAVG